MSAQQSTSWPVDVICGNVPDLPAALAALRELTGLTPFLSFELELDYGVVPVALVQFGEQSLELLAHAQGERPAGLGYIRRVVVEVPGRQAAEGEIAPGLLLAVRPGPELRVAAVEVVSGAIPADADILRRACGAVGEAGAGVLTFGAVEVRFMPGDGPAPDLPPDFDTFQRLPGWIRLGLAHPRLEEATAALAAAGAALIVQPYRVLPGLRESMLRLPSGWVVQPVEQTLLRMMPVIGVKLIQRALTGRPIRFRERAV